MLINSLSGCSMFSPGSIISNAIWFIDSNTNTTFRSKASCIIKWYQNSEFDIKLMNWKLFGCSHGGFSAKFASTGRLLNLMTFARVPRHWITIIRILISISISLSLSLRKAFIVCCNNTTCHGHQYRCCCCRRHRHQVVHSKFGLSTQNTYLKIHLMGCRRREVNGKKMMSNSTNLFVQQY